MDQLWEEENTEYSPDLDLDNCVYIPNKDECLKQISSQLKRIFNGQHYHKNRLQGHLIYLMWNLMNEEKKEVMHDGVCLTQMSAKKGIESYGEEALQAMIRENEQLEDLTVFQPIPKTELTLEM